MALVKTLLRKRVMLTMQPEEYDLVSRFAKAQHKSRAAVFMDLFTELRPILERTVAIIEAAENAQIHSKSAIRRAAEQSEAVVTSHLRAAQDQFDWLLQQATHKGDETTQGRDAAASAGVQSAQPGRRHSRVKRASGATVKSQKARKRARAK